VWYNDTIDPSEIEIIFGNFSDSSSIFVTDNGDIFIDDGRSNNRVDKWISNTDTFETVMVVNSSCLSLFLDTNNTLYCSMIHYHQIIKRWLTDNETDAIIAAGTGTEGSASNELSIPAGIFVDDDTFDLYVADWGNNRIQCFQLNQLHGITVAGHTFQLNSPTGVVLDGDKYLFIVDRFNNRIVRQTLNGFSCFIGCDSRGSQSHQLNQPFTFHFDSYGNIFVADTDNNRIQKFLFIQNSCQINSSNVNSIYASSITSNSPTFFSDCSLIKTPYEAIQINVTITGFYQFQCENTSTIPFHVILYKNNFNPFNASQNLHNGNILQANSSYILVVTTTSREPIRNFMISISGPMNVSFTPLRINASIVRSTHSLNLSNTSSIYMTRCIASPSYYEAIKINVRTTGIYTITSSIVIVTHAAIYTDNFNPFNPLENLLLTAYQNCKDIRFRLTISLQSDQTYILVVSTQALALTSLLALTVSVSGPNYIDLISSDFPSVVRPDYVEDTQWIYESMLTTSSDTYSRDCIQSNYYYEAIEMNVIQSGYYAFVSDSQMNMFGDIYEQNFNRINPFENLLAQGYRACSYFNFLLVPYLNAHTTYILIVTTYSANITANFSIEIRGPENVTMKRLSESIYVRIKFLTVLL